MELSSQSIEGMAPNAAAAKNGRDLVAKDKFSGLSIDADGRLIWGQCAGSGKKPYYCSADFIHPESPVFRCSCPSRQFPCKHCIGLLYAHEKGLNFTVAEVPEDIAGKREKLEKRQEKKIQEKQTLKEKAAAPKKVNTAAVVKKINTQLAGLNTAAALLSNIVNTGLSAIDAREFKNLQEQVKELGNFYIPGVQTAFSNLLLALADVQNQVYTRAIDQINYIHALLKKAEVYLSGRKENPAAPPETGSEIEEQIGYVWKLADLVALGLYEENAELVQLSFDSYDNRARREFVDEGIWLNLKTGVIYRTHGYRPYKALKYIKEEDSAPGVTQIRELYIYPGSINPRIRWETEALTRRDLKAEDIARIHTFSDASYGQAVKTVKGVIKNPLSDKNPLLLLALHRAFRNGDHLVIQDAAGVHITLCDLSGQNTSAETLLKMVLPADCAGMSLLARVHNDVTDGIFYAQPMSLITSEKIIRLFS